MALSKSNVVPSSHWGGKLYLAWVGANTIAEIIGLGLSALLIIFLSPKFEGDLGILFGALVMIVAGTFLEGVIVGVAQWWVLRRAILGFSARAWVTMTALGAGIAWILGVIPSGLMNLNETNNASAPPTLDNLTTLSLAALMGFVLGPVLATPQWWVLRNYSQKALWWIPANALAWAFGMVIIFIAAGSLSEGSSLPTIVLTLFLSLAAAGAVVGAIHGLALFWLLGKRET